MNKFINEHNQIINPQIAEEMAYIEKPYRENELSLYKKITSSKVSEIMKGQKEAEKYGEQKYGIESYELSGFEKAKLSKKKSELIRLVRDLATLIGKKIPNKKTSDNFSNKYLTEHLYIDLLIIIKGKDSRLYFNTKNSVLKLNEIDILDKLFIEEIQEIIDAILETKEYKDAILETRKIRKKTIPEKLEKNSLEGKFLIEKKENIEIFK